MRGFDVIKSVVAAYITAENGACRVLTNLGMLPCISSSLNSLFDKFLIFNTILTISKFG